MLDGLDGIGKGKAEEGILEYISSIGLRHFSQIDFEKKNHARPEYEEQYSEHIIDLNKFDLVHTCEPSYCGTGWDIRNEIIATKNKGKYNARETLEAYSLNRLVHYNRSVIPLLKKGKHILQSRGLASSICYQKLQAKEEGKPLDEEKIFSYRGNNLALEYPPSLLIIPVINNIKELEKRLSEREKKDNSYLEQIEFQMRLQEYYKNESMRNIFKSVGTKIVEIDAGISVEETKKQAIDAVRPFFEK